MRTIYDILWDLRGRILTANPYFTHGYSYAKFMGPDQMVVATAAGPDFKYVGIQDAQGNYFYIRVNDVINTKVTPANSDCGVAVVETYSCALVAVVSDANELILKDALLNALLQSGLRVRTQNVNPESIITAEFSKLKDDVKNRAISNIGRRALIKIEFDIERNFEKSNCIYDPCKTCSQ